MKTTLVLSLFLLLISCKKDLPQSLSSGKYVWIHSQNSNNESESFQTTEDTYSFKVKANGAYKFYRNDEKVSSGKLEENDASQKLVTGDGKEHSFSVEEDAISIWGYPFSNHSNTFVKL